MSQIHEIRKPAENVQHSDLDRQRKGSQGRGEAG